MRGLNRRQCAVALFAALSSASFGGCGEDTGVRGPAFSTTGSDASDGGVVASDTAASSSGGVNDISTSSSSGAASGGADIGTSGASSSSGSDAVSSGSSGATSGGADAGAGFVCVNDADCKALLKELPSCLVGRCVNNVCQPGPAEDGETCEDGTTCTKGDECVNGSCQPGDFTCDDANPCTEDTCDAASGKCSHKAGAAGLVTKCSDGDPCTVGDTCKGDKCVGTANDCDDNNPCTDDACQPAAADKAGGCAHANNTKPCGDGDKCYASGACANGKCVAGNKLVCDDNNDCTADTCDAKTGKCAYVAGTKVTCEDGNACTAGDLCKGGKCVAGATKKCDDANPCTSDACDPTSGLCVFSNNKAACDDGNACSTLDQCKSGICVGAGIKVCDDGKVCTDDVCDPKAGCKATQNSAPCSDDKLCKLGVCNGGVCKVGDKTGCNDNNACTTDACKAGKCEYVALKAGGVCKDGDKCQKASVCAAGKCVAGALEDCSDANPCTTDGCNPKTGCVWESSVSACNDGNACTADDNCASGKCKGVVKTALCDDGNACTKDACDPTKGCQHEPTSGACDDGNICTKGESCEVGKCVGGSNEQCNDNKPCTIDNCDPKTGKCSWSGKSGACDDGNECTTGDYCKTGACVHTGKNDCDDANPCTVDSCDDKVGKCAHVAADVTNKAIACDDGDKCTGSDSCKNGKCVGTAGSLKCDDGNACTNDKCNPDTGKCGFSANNAPCDNDNKCTWGDQCKNGKCATGTNFACDDGQSCTTDSCDAATGKCSHKPMANGSKCSDGEACSTGDACSSGKCVAKDRSKCAVYTETFDCEGGAKGWALQNTQGRAVIWAVDAKPNLAKKAWGCNLNFNNNVNYCDKYTSSQGNTYCRTPTGVAWSPQIDGTKFKGTPRLIFDTYYDVDASGDNPRVELRRVGNNAYLYGFNLTKSKSKQWRHMEINVPQVKGQKFRIRFYLSGANGQGGNGGAGWFIDNLVIDQQYTAEVCNDGVDNDNNGQIDCLDIACKGKSTCKEVCDDKKDNDFDDKVDCDDPDCSSSLECTKPILSLPFNCSNGGWKYEDMKRNDVKFAIDTHKGGPTPITGQCTMNFNNGVNFCGNKSCSNGGSNANAGMATYTKQIDATSYKKALTLVYWSWIDAEPQGGNAYYDDRGFVQASYDGFKGCCGATNQCNQQNLNQCNKTATSTWIAPRASFQQKKWQKVSLNLYKFRGRKFQLRLRFNSGDGNNNQGSGWFLDDMRIYGQ